MESVHSVLVGEVNLALVTAPPQDAQITEITAVPFAQAPLYAVLAENHPAAHSYLPVPQVKTCVALIRVRWSEPCLRLFSSCCTASSGSARRRK
jgi:DNA-binding transcriptional LysR family regulator